VASEEQRAAAAPILAAGAVLVRDGLVAVVHRPRHEDWSLPKGKLKPGEGLREAAARELQEETGCEAELLGELGDVRYRVGERPKRVVFYLARCRGGDFTPGDEVDELRWLSPAEAEPLLSYERERELLRRAAPLAASI
jgi:8-oxo-dGTP pyrophosphatase MutT (NUDIX family)